MIIGFIIIISLLVITCFVLHSMINDDFRVSIYLTTSTQNHHFFDINSSILIENENLSEIESSELSQQPDAEHEDPDALIDGSKGKTIPVSNWGATYGPLRVWCLVNALYDEELLMVIQETWGRHCDKLLFSVDEEQGHNILENEAKNSKLEEIVPIQIINRKQKDLWESIWKALQHLEEHHHGEYDYVIKGDTDTWMSVNNFKSYAQYFDPQLSWYMGHTLLHNAAIPFQAGSNYALSRRAVERITKFFQTDKFQHGRSLCSAQSRTWAEDLVLGKCLREIGIHPLNTLNEQYRVSFSPVLTLVRPQGTPTLVRLLQPMASCGREFLSDLVGACLWLNPN